MIENTIPIYNFIAYWENKHNSASYKHPAPSDYLVNVIFDVAMGTNLFMLDHGCGSGRLALSLASNGVRIGINDISSTAVNNTCNLLEENNLAYKIVHKHDGILLDWNGPNQWGSFCSHRVFHCMPLGQRINTIKYLYDGLLPGGEAVISAKSVHCKRYPILLKDKSFEQIRKNSFVRFEPFRYIHYFTEEDFVSLIQDAGFKILLMSEFEEATGNVKRDIHTETNRYWLCRIRKEETICRNKRISISKRLVLFDIDGTIIEQNGIIEDSYRYALERVLKIELNLQREDVVGKTDTQIITDFISEYVSDPNDTDLRKKQLEEEYIKYYLSSLSQYDLILCKCIKELIYFLDSHDSIVLGLLTGNLETLVVPKMNEVGIDPNIFKVCSYGSDSIDRNQLPSIALKRYDESCRQSKTEDKSPQVVIIGDTPKDIECAKYSRAISIALATGHYSINELRAFDPDFLFEDACDIKQIVSAIFLQNEL